MMFGDRHELSHIIFFFFFFWDALWVALSHSLLSYAAPQFTLSAQRAPNSIKQFYRFRAASFSRNMTQHVTFKGVCRAISNFAVLWGWEHISAYKCVMTFSAAEHTDAVMTYAWIHLIVHRNTIYQCRERLIYDLCCFHSWNFCSFYSSVFRLYMRRQHQPMVGNLSVANFTAIGLWLLGKPWLLVALAGYIYILYAIDLG